VGRVQRRGRDKHDVNGDNISFLKNLYELFFLILLLLGELENCLVDVMCLTDPIIVVDWE